MIPETAREEDHTPAEHILDSLRETFGAEQITMIDDGPDYVEVKVRVRVNHHDETLTVTVWKVPAE